MDFSETLRKLLLAGVGAVAATAETAKDIIDTLVEKGEITVEQGKAMNEELKKTAKEKFQEHVTVNIVKEEKDLLKAVETMSKEEIDLLKEKIAKMENEQEESTDPKPDIREAEEKL